jgi:arylsulfatase A-like enzyme
MVVFWPKGIHDEGGLRSQFEDVTDVAPTILDAAHIPHPRGSEWSEAAAHGWHEFLATFASADSPGLRTTQYFEMLGNRAIYRRRLDGSFTQRTSSLDL